MNLEILGIGSALVDITVQVDESFLESEGLPKGGMTLVDAERSKELLDKLSPESRELSPGGATANVMASFAHCGGKAGFIGKIGVDEIGEYFTNETEKAGVTFLKLTSSQTPTGIGLTLVTPDGERTFATHLGAAVELTPEDLPSELLCQAPIIHVEAYLVFNRELIDHILDVAKKNGQRISMDLSSFDVVKENLEFFEQIAQSHLDIVFANEDESLAFTGLAPKDSLDVFSRLCEIAVVKEGGNGSHIANGSHKVYLPAESVWVVDTNGAGDAYAGAVLFGLSRGMSISTCGRIGTKAGALIVSQRGARSTAENAGTLRDFADELDLLMMRRLQASSLTPEMVADVGKEIADYHAAAEKCPTENEYGTIEWMKSATDQNFDQTGKYIGVTISPDQFEKIKTYTDTYYQECGQTFAERIKQNKIIACHGALHMEHVCLGDSVTMLDCLEFDDRFAYCDPADDVAFLAMDLDYHGRSDLSEVLVDAYIEQSGDLQIRDTLTFYKIYRAYVRGKFASFRLEDQHILADERKAVTTAAKQHFDLAESYILKATT